MSLEKNEPDKKSHLTLEENIRVSEILFKEFDFFLSFSSKEAFWENSLLVFSIKLLFSSQLDILIRFVSSKLSLQHTQGFNKFISCLSLSAQKLNFFKAAGSQKRIRGSWNRSCHS